MLHRSRQRPLGAAACCVAAVVIASATLPARSTAQQRDRRADRPEVTKLVLRGVKAVDGSELRRSIATDASHCKSLVFLPFCLFTKSHYFYQRAYLDRTEFQRDVLRIRVFYFKRGYRETAVDTSVVGGDRVTVTFRITEGPPTTVSAIQVTQAESVLTTKQVRRQLRLREGEPFDLFKLDTSLTRLRIALWDRGYGDATVADRSTVTDTVNAQVGIALTPNPRTVVGDIHISGNEDISSEVIRRSLTLQPGDLYRERERVASQRSLYESGLFKRAEVRVERDSTLPAPDSVKALHVIVTEQPPHAARVSAGFNTVDFFQIQTRYTNYNLLGGARRLDLVGTVGNLLSDQLNGRPPFRRVTLVPGDERARYFAPTYQASADVTQRFFRNPRNTLTVGVFGHRRSSPGIFIDHGYGAHGTLTREVAERSTLSLDYRFELSGVQAGDVYFCVNYGVCDFDTIDALRRPQRLSPLTLAWRSDHSDDPFSPHRGYRLQADAQHASKFTISDFRYNRLYGEGSVYIPLTSRMVLATHARLGWVKPLASTGAALGALDVAGLLHPRTRFYAGGSQSVRGYAENQLGPRILTIAPETLRTATRQCTTGLPIQSCDPNARDSTGALIFSNTDFTPRPLGGSTLVEGSVELRFPIWQALSGAVFVDGGVVGSGGLEQATTGTGAITPGIGVRYKSPVGPIRVDLGYNPVTSEDLLVFTENDAVKGPRRPLVQLDERFGRRRYETSGFRNRLVLHLSIGEAY